MRARLCADLVVNDGRQEVLRLERRAVLDVLVRLDEPLAHVHPQRLRHVHARRRRALLTTVLERRAHRAVDDRLQVRSRVHEVKVLAATFLKQQRIVCGGVDQISHDTWSCMVNLDCQNCTNDQYLNQVKMNCILVKDVTSHFDKRDSINQSVEHNGQ